MTGDAQAWNFACTLFNRTTPTLIATLPCAPRALLSALVEAHVVAVRPYNNAYVLCPECHQQHGLVVDLGVADRRAIGCDCPDCGIVTVTPDYRLTVEIDIKWLVAQLRLALDVSSDEAVVELAEGIWRIGTVLRQPVVLGRSVRQLQGRPALLAQLHDGAGRPVIVITPQPPLPLQAEPFDDRVVWLPLQRSFVFDGKRLSCIEPAVLRRPRGGDDATTDPRPVHGPFSEDFRWVYRPHGAVLLSPAQAAVMEVLWSFKGVPQRGELIMARAGLKGSKPAVVFKVKRENKDKAQYEGPKQVYAALVVVNARDGTYALRWEEDWGETPPLLRPLMP
ncbi:hypothetical protein [Caldimonas brevitalea]|uniref:Uncharacterized protein n=1 Tax=Caldimonas brevitalea TaxID=413882 RepID=A0A0G3BVU3_9BURK|nr:hypothetical protein [Caldimonas brevitalea]AKJ30650.1 hypothetical protein AAW51_3959 [Caldimonas brevitalea]